ncbi:MAG: SH3 domain-containing protein [Acidobacteria bacterium]|nr:SH3 domain-containing protein [Acidobacteriota bacterium]
MAAASVGAQETIPIEVQDVDLRTNETMGTVVLRTEQSVEWSAEAGSRTLVLLVQRSVPGPKALDRSSRTGLVSLVEVGFAVPSGVPTTRITIHSRKAFEYEVESSGTGLTIRLRTTETQTVSPEARSVTSAKPQTETPATDAEELEKVLRENDLLRQRMVELHFDRLQLRKSVDGARAELADQAETIAIESARTSELELENGRLNARTQELSERLEAAEKQAHAEELMAENRLLSDELSAQQARLVESQQGAVRLRAKLDRLERELSMARAGVDSKAGDSRAAKERLAESAAREQALAESLANTTVLRAWLSKAPEILQATDFVVSPGDSCLPLRPEPSSKSAVLECLPVGSALETLSFRPEWLRVRTEGNREGWIRAARVAPSRPAPPAAPAADATAQAALVEARTEAAGAKSRLAELERKLEAARIDYRKARAESEVEQRRMLALRVELDLGQAAVSARADPCLTVRAAPGVDQRRLDCLRPGTAVSIDDATAGWLSVRTAAGVSGWVASSFVQSSQAFEASERTAALERSRQMLEVQVGDLSSRLQEATAEGERKGARLEDLEQQQAPVRERSEALAAQVADLSAELADERNRLQQTGAKRQQAEEALAALRSQQKLQRTEALSALEVAQVVVKEDVDPCLSLRQEPAVGSRALDCLPPGTQLAAVALAGGWLRVRLEDGREGWSSREFLESAEQRELRSLEARVADRDEKIVSLENRLAAAKKGETER